MLPARNCKGKQTMKLTWFGHSAFRLDLDGAVVMIDPFLDNPTFKGNKKQAWAGATHVLLTHGHNDHTGDALEIVKDTGATLFAMVELADTLQMMGADSDKVVGASFGGDVRLGTLTVSLVPALHSASYFADGKITYAGQPAGLVIRAPGERTLLHMGDTSIFGDMALIHELYEPKIGIVPIGGHFTMDARVASLACRRYYKFETAIPCHYGTFGLLAANADGFVAGMEGSGTRVLVPERGVSVEV